MNYYYVVVTQNNMCVFTGDETSCEAYAANFPTWRVIKRADYIRLQANR